MTDNEYDKAAKLFAKNVVKEIAHVDNLTSLLLGAHLDGYETPTQWREGNPFSYSQAVRIAATLGIEGLEYVDAYLPDVELALDEYVVAHGGYGLTVSKIVRVTLAGGGPSASIDFHLDEAGDLERAEITYTDWFRSPVTYRLDYDEAEAAFRRYRIDVLADAPVH